MLQHTHRCKSRNIIYVSIYMYMAIYENNAKQPRISSRERRVTRHFFYIKTSGRYRENTTRNSTEKSSSRRYAARKIRLRHIESYQDREYLRMRRLRPRLIPRIFLDAQRTDATVLSLRAFIFLFPLLLAGIENSPAIVRRAERDPRSGVTESGQTDVKRSVRAVHVASVNFLIRLIPQRPASCLTRRCDVSNHRIT